MNHCRRLEARVAFSFEVVRNANGRVGIRRNGEERNSAVSVSVVVVKSIHLRRACNLRERREENRFSRLLVSALVISRGEVTVASTIAQHLVSEMKKIYSCSYISLLAR